MPSGNASRTLSKLGFTGSRVHGFTGSRVHGFTGSQVHRFTGSQVHRCTGAMTRQFLAVCGAVVGLASALAAQQHQVKPDALPKPFATPDVRNPPSVVPAAGRRLADGPEWVLGEGVCRRRLQADALGGRRAWRRRVCHRLGPAHADGPARHQRRRDRRRAARVCRRPRATVRHRLWRRAHLRRQCRQHRAVAVQERAARRPRAPARRSSRCRPSPGTGRATSPSVPTARGFTSRSGRVPTPARPTPTARWCFR